MDLAHVTYLSVLLVLLGSLIILLSVKQTGKLIEILDDDERKTRWTLLRSFMRFFLIGYGVSVWLILGQRHQALLFLVGLVFFFGALFVLKTVQAGLDSIASMNEVIHVRTEALSKANEELSQFAWGASHDLREPLRATSCFLALLKERVGPRLADEEAMYLEEAIGGSLRLQQMLDGLQIMLETETQKKPVESISSDRAVNDALLNLSGLIEESDAQIEIDTLPEVVFHSIQLTRILQNLIANACRYRSLDRPLEVKIDSETRERDTVFLVTDNGIGIEERYHKMIFEPFKRLHSKADIDGTGLGLAFCKKVVERHDGTIWLKSQPGDGTTFFFTIPHGT